MPGSTVTTIPGSKQLLLTLAQPRRFVNIQTDAVTQAVPEIAAEARVFDHCRGRRYRRRGTTRRAEWPRWPGPALLTQLHTPVRVWAGFYRSPTLASSRSCRARRRLPNRPARSRPRQSACPSVGRGATPPGVRQRRSTESSAPLPRTAASGIRIGRRLLFRSAPAGARPAAQRKPVRLARRPGGFRRFPLCP